MATPSLERFLEALSKIFKTTLRVHMINLKHFGSNMNIMSGTVMMIKHKESKDGIIFIQIMRYIGLTSLSPLHTLGAMFKHL